MTFFYIPADPPELDNTIKSLYAVISGPVGQERDWKAFHELFASDAKFWVATKRNGKSVLVTMTPADYEKRSGPFLKSEGFFEKELWRGTRIYGEMAQVWTAYESRLKSADAKPFERGINAITLLKVDGKWKVVSLAWTSESDAGPLPKKDTR